MDVLSLHGSTCPILCTFLCTQNTEESIQASLDVAGSSAVAFQPVNAGYRIVISAVILPTEAGEAPDLCFGSTV